MHVHVMLLLPDRGVWESSAFSQRPVQATAEICLPFLSVFLKIWLANSALTIAAALLALGITEEQSSTCRLWTCLQLPSVSQPACRLLFIPV